MITYLYTSSNYDSFEKPITPHHPTQLLTNNLLLTIHRGITMFTNIRSTQRYIMFMFLLPPFHITIHIILPCILTTCFATVLLIVGCFCKVFTTIRADIYSSHQIMVYSHQDYSILHLVFSTHPSFCLYKSFIVFP